MPQGINTGEILEALNDKMDRDGHNVQSPSAVIIETYDDGNGNGYILYSNNWCIQYGVYDNGSLVQRIDADITFLKPFSDNSYTITITAYRDNNIMSDIDVITYINKKETTNAHIIAYGANGNCTSRYISWKAEGYIS